MKRIQEHFNQVRRECIQECRNYSLEEIAKGMFKKDEIINLFLSLEKTDEAYSIIVDLMQKYFKKSCPNRVYIPGCGSGGLTRRIIKAFPNITILQVDNSPEMIFINKQVSSSFIKTEFITADILKYFPEKNSIDMIVAYGIMRYIPSEMHNDLISSWADCLTKDGITIIGEGVAKEIVTLINPTGYKSEKNIERDANLFRYTLFYLLFQRYNTDKTFKNDVLSISSMNGLNYVQVLRDIAGFTENKVYVKLLTK